MCIFTIKLYSENILLQYHCNKLRFLKVYDIMNHVDGI